MPSVIDDTSSNWSAHKWSSEFFVPAPTSRRVRLISGRFPVHVVNLIPAAAAAISDCGDNRGPLHQQRVLENQWHLVHRAVARRAADALADVNAGIEIRKIAEAMDFDPWIDRRFR